ncbi:MAG: lipopolysaccharide biosynthesis protein [Bacteroidota bacterium]
MSLKKKTINGTIWTFAEQISVKGLNFVVQIVLARLLLPEDFGLIAMVMVFIGIGNAIVESGMIQSLIRTKEPDQRDFSTVFFLNISIAFLVYALIFFIAPIVGEFYEQSRLALILRVLALSVLIRSFMGVQYAILSIKMDFKSQMLIQTPSLIISGVVAILMAYLNYGVWALVTMQIVMAVLVTVQYWWRSDWRPQFVFDRERLKSHFQFGYKLTLTTAVNSLSNNIYSILIGKYFSAASLGYYNRASVYQRFLPLLVGGAVNRVTLPLFSKLIDDKLRLSNALRNINKIVMYAYLPIVLFFIFNAEGLITFLLTERWLAVVPLFQVLCIGGLLQPMQFYSINILGALGNSGHILSIATASRFITIVGAIVMVQFGLNALVLFETVALLAITLLYVHFSGKHINYPLLDQFKDILPELILSITCSFLCAMVCKFLLLESQILNMLTYISLFIPLYLVCSHLFRISAFQTLKSELIKWQFK